MPSANAALAERVLTHAIQLERAKAGEVASIRRLLLRLERDLLRDLQNANLTAFRRDRYERLLETTRQTIRTHYRTIRDTHADKMTDLAGLETAWAVRSLNSTLSEPIGTYISFFSVGVSPQQLRAIAGNVVIDKSPASVWWSKQAADLRVRFGRVVKSGLLRGIGTPEIVRQVRQEVLEVSRSQATALVRSSISAVAHEARRETYNQFDTVIRGVQHLSTLDTRTSEICVAYDQRMWNLDHQPIGHSLPYKEGVPRHFQCRSTEVSVLKSWSELAGRPIREGDPQTLDEIFRSKLRAMGWSDERIAAAQMRTRASVDGQVPRETTFGQFLDRKGAAFQDEVLGKGKADLYRRGLLTDTSRLLDFGGNPLTLRQLKQQYDPLGAGQ
jgi:SPP1 gp7 family putative phage head morphogenesis protein